MEFRVLGPLRVRRDDGQPCVLQPRHARFLAVLLLHPNQTVSYPLLVATMWTGTRPPPTVKRQVQNCVSTLRRQLGADRIEFAAPGYLLRVEPGELDADAFRDLVAGAERSASAGQAADAAERLRSALRLWRGPALSGCRSQTIEAGAARLDEQRLVATELCIELELGLGRHARLVGELTELVADHPLRERLVGQLMLALYRSGRQADALAAYRQLRTRLAEDLGLDPAADIQELHRSILRNTVDSPTTAEAAVPRQLPASIRHFAGRAAELKELTRLADEAVATAGTTVIAAIDGTAGVGKSATVIHWAHQVASRFPDGQLYVNLRGFDPVGSPVAPAAAIRGFLDALGVPAEQLPAGLDEQASRYRSRLAGRRILIILDNARDADQVRPLLPGTAGCLVVVTSRNHLTSLVATHGAVPITLDLLSPGEAGELLAGHLGPARLAAAPKAADELIARCARLPLALSIVAARAAAQPTVPLTTFGHPLDTLDAVLSWTYGRLTEPAARLFRLLGVHPGPDIGAAAAASLAGEDLLRVRGQLAELVGARLVTENVPGRYTFHDLLRAYAAELAGSTSDGMSEAIHRILDHYLHTAHTAALLLHPRHTPVLRTAAQPGVTPERLADHGQAFAWFTAECAGLLAAIRLAGEAGHDVHAWQIAWSLNTFLYRQGRWHDLFAAHELGLAAAQRLGDLAAQAYANQILGRACAALRRYDEAFTYDRRALELAHAAGAVAILEHLRHPDADQVRTKLADPEPVAS